MDAPHAEQAASAPRERPLSGIAQIEKLIVLNATNRFIWLVYILAALLLLQLSLVQRNTVRFDTMDLVAILLATLEAATIISLMLLLGSTGWTRQRWLARYPATPFSYIANVIAVMLLCVVVAFIMLVPLLLVHEYPDLIAKGIRVPLTMVQRLCVILGLALIVTNLACILRFYARLPWAVAAALGLVIHVILGYLLTVGSTQIEVLRRLNDVFYYNQLWHYFDSVPNLSNPQVFHNMEPTHTALYMAAGAALWLVTFLLWLPRASLDAAREARRAG